MRSPGKILTGLLIAGLGVTMLPPTAIAIPSRPRAVSTPPTTPSEGACHSWASTTKCTPTTVVTHPSTASGRSSGPDSSALPATNAATSPATTSQ